MSLAEDLELCGQQSEVSIILFCGWICVGDLGFSS